MSEIDCPGKVEELCYTPSVSYYKKKIKIIFIKKTKA